jgi:signal transduction histidine kinase
MLAYPGGNLAGRPTRLAVGIALVVAVVALGVLPTLYFDPGAQGCAECPKNLLLLSADPTRAETLARVGLFIGLGSVLGLLGVTVWQLARSSIARVRVVAPVVIAAGAYLILAAWTYAAGLDRGFVGAGDVERALWFGQAIALAALGSTIIWGRMRVARTRYSLARLVVELAETGHSGSLREALAHRLGDAQLEVAYPIGDGRYVAPDGRPVSLPSERDRVQTPFVRDGGVVAIVIHRRGLLDDPDFVEDVASAARLVLENERLRAELLAQEGEMRASRTRIVEAGDAERRRAERDLHDGAQQRLVGLLLGLRLARGRLGPTTQGGVARRLDAATVELHSAVDHLRELAHGIHPAVLSDDGLFAAFDALAERTPTRLRITGTPQGRLPSVVETAAYRIVAEAARTGPTEVRLDHRGRSLFLDVVTEEEPGAIQDLQDRVGAIGGVLHTESRNGGVSLHAVLPCEEIGRSRDLAGEAP